jgi:hypothetical protein
MKVRANTVASLGVGIVVAAILVASGIRGPKPPAGNSFLTQIDRRAAKPSATRVS